MVFIKNKNIFLCIFVKKVVKLVVTFSSDVKAKYETIIISVVYKIYYINL